MVPRPGEARLVPVARRRRRPTTGSACSAGRRGSRSGDGRSYYHAYLREQPDLNWRNPAVREAMLDVLAFWIDRGVDGFRVDAMRQLLKDPQLRDNPPNPRLPRRGCRSTTRCSRSTRPTSTRSRRSWPTIRARDRRRPADDRRGLRRDRAARPLLRRGRARRAAAVEHAPDLDAVGRRGDRRRWSSATRPRCPTARGRTGCSATTTGRGSPAASARRRRAWRRCSCSRCAARRRSTTATSSGWPTCRSRPSGRSIPAWRAIPSARRCSGTPGRTRLQRPASRGCRTASGRRRRRSATTRARCWRSTGRLLALRRGRSPRTPYRTLHAAGRRARLRARRSHGGRAQPHRRAAAAAGRRRRRAEHPPGRRRRRRCGPTRASFLHSESCSRPVRSCCSARSSTASTPPASRWRRRRSPPTPTSRAGRRRSATSSRCSRSRACWRIRTPPPAACRPTPATATSSIACCRRGREGKAELQLSLVRREVDEAMRVTTETLSQVTNLLAIVSRAADRHHDDPPRRGAPAPAAGADGRRHHLDRRRVQARLHVRPARSTPGWPTGPPPTSTSSSRA